jgi:hypothetical protein
MVILWWFIGCSTFLSLPKQPAIFEDVCPSDWCLTGQPFCLATDRIKLFTVFPLSKYMYS